MGRQRAYQYSSARGRFPRGGFREIGFDFGGIHRSRFEKVHLFSILRDTYVDIPGHGKGRLNSAFAYGGTNLTRQTVSELLDIPIHKYVYTDFVGFIALVDALGGVDIEVERDMHYTSKADQHLYDIDLKKGTSILTVTWPCNTCVSGKRQGRILRVRSVSAS